MRLDYTDKAKIALVYAEKASKNMKSSYVGTEHILLGLLKENTGVAAQVLRNNKVEEERIAELINESINPDSMTLLKERRDFSLRARRALESAERIADGFGSKEIGTEHILIAILREQESVAVRLIMAMGVSPAKVYGDIMVAIGQTEKLREEQQEHRNKKGGKEKTATLDKYSRDLTKLAKAGKLDPVVGRNQEIQRIIQILSRRTKNNPCLVGEPGVGKSAIVEGIATRIVNGDVPESMKGMRVLMLDLPGMVAGSKYRGEFEERIKRVIEEVIDDGHVILFLDEIHTMVGAGGAEGSIDASNILKPSLARGELQLIGATTVEEYRKYFEKDAALERRFQPVTVEEPTIEETVDILRGIAHKYEEHHSVTITDEALMAAANLAARYINDRHLPDKAIDLIDEAASAAKLHVTHIPDSIRELQALIEKKQEQIERSITMEAFAQAGEIRSEQDKLKKKLKRQIDNFEKKAKSQELVVDEEAIAEVISLWTKIPVKKLTIKESERLLGLEEALHKRVIGQEEAVSAVARAIRRQRVGLQDPNRPIGSFLFLGPTGVGKTELSKALAEVVFGSEDSLIRVDMTEYMEAHSVSKMIGSPPGYVGHDEGGQLVEKVRKHPYSVVLFDEIEKAHPDVFNILLQIFDDGHITDSKGRKVSFKNTILIMTSNAGANRIVDPKKLGFVQKTSAELEYKAMKDGVMEEVKRIFKPEFINRIDEIIVFHALNSENLSSITTLLCKSLVSRCKKQMDIKLTIPNASKKYIVEKFTNIKMGARPLKRAVQTFIEDELATQLLEGNILRGDSITMSVKDDKAVFTKK